MSEWKKVKIGDFLTEREGRYKPDDSKISKYKRLDKIDFSGTIHISDKPTKTDMIIVHPGDLVISGINVAKGAVAVYQGNEPVCATIHYSSYTFDSSKVDLDYFKYFVKSPAFIAALQKQVKGGIKTEIKPKHLLPLEISIPDLQTQQRIVKKISLQLQKTEQLYLEIEYQKNYIKQLRQNILQDAIEGKLTADWRKQNPVQKGNPNYDAEALFEQILKERNNKKKQKELSPITDEEKTFEIPEGWKWVRLGEISNKITDGTHKTPKYTDSGIKFVSAKDIYNKELDFSHCKYISENEHKELYKRCNPELNDLLISKSGSIGTVVLNNVTFEFSLFESLALIKYNQSELMPKFMNFAVQYICNNLTVSDIKGVCVKHLHLNVLSSQTLGLPPLAEQKEIVNKAEILFAKVTTLENQIQDRKSLSDKLIFSIIKENLEG
ncbi:MAG: restriction endonuclease subunit S [Lachnospiraceae bacterium]|nr:restriction endonuclease subunit S [Lachnospiraceae bacterium]